MSLSMDPNQVFRDGPFMNPHEPEKWEIRRLLTEHMQAILALIGDRPGLTLPNLLIRYTVTGGTPNAIQAAPNLPVPGPGLALFSIILTQVNSGPVTINGKPLLSASGQQLPAGALKAGAWLFLDEGSNFRLVNEFGVQFLAATNTGGVNAIAATTPTPVPGDRGALIVLPIAAENTNSNVSVRFNGGPALPVRGVDGEPLSAGDLVAGLVATGYIADGVFRLTSDPSSLRNKIAAQAAQIASESGAARSEAARDIAEGYASDAVSQGNVPIYGTLSGISGIEIPEGLGAFRTNGYSALGDRGADLFRKVAAEPSHLAKVQSSDGAWWEKAAPEVYVTQFGARGDGVTDDTLAIQRAIDYLSQNQGGTVVFPAGIYRALNVILKAGVRLRGMGAADWPMTSEKRSASALRALSSFAPGDAIIKGDPTLTGSRFAGGGVMDLAFIGPEDSVSERPTVANGLADVSGLDFSSMPVGTWMQQFIIQNCFFYGLKKGAHLGQGSGVVRYVPMWGNRFWNCETGLRVESGHPNFGVNEFRFCDVGVSSNGFWDVAFHGTKFNHNRVGLEGDLLRVALIGCMFWQNRELGCEINGETQLIGCLLRGDGATENGRLIRVNQRNNMIIGNRFAGDHLGAAIEFAPSAGITQALNIVALNTAFINRGRFMEVNGPGALSSLHVEGNQALISSSGDGQGGQFFHAPASGGTLPTPAFLNNTLRLEGVDQAHAPVTVKASGGGHGPLNKGNRVYANGVAVAGGFDFSGGNNGGGIHTGNQFRSSPTGSYTAPLIVPGSLAGAIIKDNGGFLTENSGTATIASGATFVEVPHGLDIAPLAANICVTPTGSAGASKGYWISNVTATTFRINIPSANTGAAGYVWQISAPRLA